MSDLASNLDKLAGFLEKHRASGITNLINGEARPAASGQTFETTSPVDESVICSVTRGGADDIDAAAKAAKAAFPAWRDLPATERKAIQHRIADGIVARAEEIALCECWDTGQALRFMSKAALRGAENFRFFADRALSRPRWPDAALADADERHHPRAHRPRRCHHAVEHALYALHVEDRARPRRRLHSGP